MSQYLAVTVYAQYMQRDKRCLKKKIKNNVLNILNDYCDLSSTKNNFLLFKLSGP